MTRVRLSAAAKRDLESLADDSLERFGSAARRRLLLRLRDALRRLAEDPLSGRERPELGPELRSVLVLGRFAVLHRVVDDRVEVVRVLPCSRALADELER